jgi:hypothetical protein
MHIAAYMTATMTVDTNLHRLDLEQEHNVQEVQTSTHTATPSTWSLAACRAQGHAYVLNGPTAHGSPVPRSISCYHVQLPQQQASVLCAQLDQPESCTHLSYSRQPLTTSGYTQAAAHRRLHTGGCTQAKREPLPGLAASLTSIRCAGAFTSWWSFSPLSSAARKAGCCCSTCGSAVSRMSRHSNAALRSSRPSSMRCLKGPRSTVRICYV